MTAGAPRRLLVATAVLVVAAAVVLARSDGTDAAQRERQRNLQHAVGGLGLGPALDLRRGVASFDPRIGTRAHGGASIVGPGAP